ncbi:hypothetical protein OKW49_001701 [Paraburkholderia youngii]|uniref:hypothetical protein n=1 Tax=Paraburkholderia TaxID=1822464 RepID=UPI0034CE8E3B
MEFEGREKGDITCRGYVLATFVRAFILGLFLVFPLPGISNVVEQMNYPIPFFNDGTRIGFRAEPNQDGNRVRAYLTGVTETGSVLVDLYEAEGGVNRKSIVCL